MSANEYVTHRYYQHNEIGKVEVYQTLRKMDKIPKLDGGGHIEHHAETYDDMTLKTVSITLCMQTHIKTLCFYLFVSLPSPLLPTHHYPPAHPPLPSSLSLFLFLSRSLARSLSCFHTQLRKRYNSSNLYPLSLSFPYCILPSLTCL